MTNPYLDIFLKKRNIHCIHFDPFVPSIHGGENNEQPVEENQTSGDIISSIKNVPLNTMNSTKNIIKNIKNKISGTNEDEIKLKELAQKITDSIQKAFSVVSQKEKIRQLDLQKIEKLIIEKPINLNFGGGFLIFGPDLKVSSMVHIFNKENQPFYFEKQFSSSIEDNTINQALKSEETYNVKIVSQKIKNILKTS